MSELAFVSETCGLDVLSLTNREALYAIYSMHNFAYANRQKKDKNSPYGPGFFTDHEQWLGVEKESRRVAKRLAASPCIVCHEPLTENSKGDHIVAISKGGRDSLENFLPLCRRHNSSKGSKDLMEWLLSKNWLQNLREDQLSLDILCAYSRETYRWLKEREELEDPAPEFLRVSLIVIADIYFPANTFCDYFSALFAPIRRGRQ